VRVGRGVELAEADTGQERVPFAVGEGQRRPVTVLRVADVDVLGPDADLDAVVTALAALAPATVYLTVPSPHPSPPLRSTGRALRHAEESCAVPGHKAVMVGNVPVTVRPCDPCHWSVSRSPAVTGPVGR